MLHGNILRLFLWIATVQWDRKFNSHSIPKGMFFSLMEKKTLVFATNMCSLLCCASLASSLSLCFKVLFISTLPECYCTLKHFIMGLGGCLCWINSNFFVNSWLCLIWDCVGLWLLLWADLSLVLNPRNNKICSLASSQLQNLLYSLAVFVASVFHFSWNSCFCFRFFINSVLSSS